MVASPQVVYVKMTRAEFMRRVYALPAQLSGADSSSDLARGLKLRIGVALLSEIQQAYLEKARGGTDFGGVSWPKLSKKYLAYNRQFAPGEQAGLKRAAGLDASHRRAPGDKKGLLTGPQLKMWRQIYSRMLRWFRLRDMDDRSAKSAAAQVAWARLKAMGAKTKLEVFGNRDVEILRDTGVLFASLTPGFEDVPSGAENQIFEVQPTSVVVGTSVPYAAAHHYGRGVPQRRLWPELSNWPRPVWNRIVGAATSGMARAIALTLTRSA